MCLERRKKTGIFNHVYNFRHIDVKGNVHNISTPKVNEDPKCGCQCKTQIES